MNVIIDISLEICSTLIIMTIMPDNTISISVCSRYITGRGRAVLLYYYISASGQMLSLSIIISMYTTVGPQEML